MDFYPYHPLKLRLWVSAGLLVALALTAWALGGAADTNAGREVLRGGMSLGLAAGFAMMLYRLRPREDWGVRLTTRSILVSRARTGTIEVPWETVREVRRLGDRRDTLALWLGERERVLVPAHLFARRADFEALVQRIEERLPPPRYDA